MNLKVVEYKDQRVLTTTQLADAYGATRQQISRNFTRNVDRYKEGKHFYQLSGEAKRDFLNRVQIDDGLKNSVVMYLWTEKGAWLHAKSLNTDQAWDAYETLVDDYYAIKTESLSLANLSPELQMFKQLWDGLAKKEIEDAKRDEEIKEIKTTVTVIKDTFLHKDDNWRKSINRMLNQAVNSSNYGHQEIRRKSYQLLEERARCKLSVRLQNLKDRLEESGATATRVKEATKLEVIESDARLKEIYTTIVKELSIGSLV
ncbi:ORF6N domain-containing protein [Shouchella tritolerans]|uniref:ORF6N domain-containing protein n=1 Tax=Shouchella tritolerans TaxID=2979466 RepID=UPI0021E7424C|nr:ORF6N domain-containing protein [Shouchella tritolerans]